MMDEFEPLTEVELAYARVACRVDRIFTEACDHDDYVRGVEQLRCDIERMGGLNRRAKWQWQTKTPLHLLHDFSDGERALLLDLADSGGTLKGRTYDRRFDWLGCGTGGKKAVMVSAMGGTWTTSLTKRGKALVEKWRAEEVTPA
jgi:hypothetical protein